MRTVSFKLSTHAKSVQHSLHSLFRCWARKGEKLKEENYWISSNCNIMSSFSFHVDSVLLDSASNLWNGWHEEGACPCLHWGTWTRLHFHWRGSHYLFAVLVVLGKKYIHVWCWNDDIAMWVVFFLIIVTLCINIGKLLNIELIYNSLHIICLFLLCEFW